MQVWVKVEHYLPTGYACVYITQGDLTKRLPLYINRPEKECERAIKKIIKQMEKLQVGQQMTCWATHKLDQFVAEQRRWDSRKEDGDEGNF